MLVWPLLIYRCRRYGYPFRRIPLTQGQYAIVDPDDYYWLSQHNYTENSHPSTSPTNNNQLNKLRRCSLLRTGKIRYKIDRRQLFHVWLTFLAPCNLFHDKVLHSFVIPSPSKRQSLNGPIGVTSVVNRAPSTQNLQKNPCRPGSKAVTYFVLGRLEPNRVK